MGGGSVKYRLIEHTLLADLLLTFFQILLCIPLIILINSYCPQILGTFKKNSKKINDIENKNLKEY